MEKPGNNCYLDANILISFLQKDSPFHQKAKNLIRTIRTSQLSPTISPLCLDEFLYNFPGSQTQKFLAFKKILKLPNLNIINPPTDPKGQIKILKITKKFRLGPRDSYHILTMKYNKIKYFATFDHDFDLVFSTQTLKQFIYTPPVFL